MSEFLTRDRVAAYLLERGHAATAGDDGVGLPLSSKDPGAGRMMIAWDAARRLVSVSAEALRVPAGQEARLAAAISALNTALEVVGYRLRGGHVVFGLSAPMNGDGTLSSSVLERMLAITHLAVTQQRPELERAARGEPPRAPRLRGPVQLGRREVELDETERAALAAALVRDLPAASALLALPHDVVEIVQPWFPRHRVLEVRVARGPSVHVALDERREVRVLTGHIEALNRMAWEALPGQELADEEAAASYARLASFWARPSIDERPVDSPAGVAGVPAELASRIGPPRVDEHVQGLVVTMWLVASGRLLERQALLTIDHAQLELFDEVLAEGASDVPPAA